MRDENQLVVLEEERRVEDAAHLDKEMVADVQEGTVGMEMLAQRITLDAVRGAERLMQTLDVCDEQEAQQEAAKRRGLPAPPVHPLLLALLGHFTQPTDCCPKRAFLQALRRVRLEELEPALLALPVSAAERVLVRLIEGAERGWETERCARCLLLLVSIHRPVWSASSRHGLLLERAVAALKRGPNGPKQQAKMMAFNIAGLNLLSLHMQEENELQSFRDIPVKNLRNRRRRVPQKTIDDHE